MSAICILQIMQNLPLPNVRGGLRGRVKLDSAFFVRDSANRRI
ncbi:hypothetical protein ACWIUD_10975 [Helicobacter sp. 23-1044]